MKDVFWEYGCCRMPKTGIHQKLYLGKSGQLAVMAELAYLGYNVSTPEIDDGDDVFAVNTLSNDLFRIQVKTKTLTHVAARNISGYRAQFQINKNHLKNEKYKDMYYCFVGKIEQKWNIAVIGRAPLYALFQQGVIAANAEGDVIAIPVCFYEDGSFWTGVNKNRKELRSFSRLDEIFERIYEPLPEQERD